jgi:GMP synthase (glutamine-hydrolysing)
VKTLIISSYHASWAPKIGPVAEMVGSFSEYEVVSDADLTPGHDLAGYGALVLSGSPNLISKEEYLPHYVEFLRRVELPVLGICYGHQLLAVAHGARVVNGPRFIEGYDTIRILEPEPLFHGLPEEIVVMESHREHVVQDDLVRSGFRLLANSSTSDVEAMRHVKKPLFGLQFHLERSGEIGRQVMENFFKFVRGFRPRGGLSG